MNAPASKQVAMAADLIRTAPRVAAAFRSQSQTWKKLPNHYGFRRVAINREKESDFSGAIATCREAKQQGWSGDWDKRIERCQGKQAKSNGKTTSKG